MELSRALLLVAAFTGTALSSPLSPRQSGTCPVLNYDGLSLLATYNYIFKFQCGADYYGNDIHNQTIVDSRAPWLCADACGDWNGGGNTPACAGAVYNSVSQICWLKSALDKQTPAADGTAIVGKGQYQPVN